jgi:NAD(P)H-nitrite reductase large subunit
MQLRKKLPDPSLGLVVSSHSRQGLLVIGNGGAAIHAIKAARTAGYQGTIHLVSDTVNPAFNPMLSTYYLSGEITYERCFPYGQEFYKKHTVRCHFGSPVEAIDIKNQKVYLDNGKTIFYDYCLIATGARPLLPPVPGLKSSHHVFTLRTAEQLTRLHRALSGAKKAIVLGASLIGVKLVETLMKKGIEVTLVELTRQVLPFSAHPQFAPILHEHLLEQGVDLRLGWILKRVQEAERGVSLHFQEGQILHADMVLVCIGVKPNVEFLRDTPIRIDRGVIVDDHMRTNIETIYAAGDVTQGKNQLTGKKEIIGCWGNACFQGRTVGLNISGMDVSYPGYLPQSVNHFFGITFIHLGDINPQDKEVELLKQFNPVEGVYHLLIFNEGVLTGANLISRPEEGGRFRTSILRKFKKDELQGRTISYPSGKEFGRIKPIFYPLHKLFASEKIYVTTEEKRDQGSNRVY